MIQGVGHHSSHHYVAKPSTSQPNLFSFVNNVLYKWKAMIGGYWTDQVRYWFYGCSKQANDWSSWMNEWIETCKQWVYVRWMDVCTCKQIFCFQWMKSPAVRRGLCKPLPTPLFRRMVSSGTLTCNKVEVLIFLNFLFPVLFIKQCMQHERLFCKQGMLL